eukprot:bmy_17388T0
MEKRETFVQAVSKELIGEFLQFIQLDKDASDPFNLSELLDELSRKQKEELWQRLKNLLTDVLVESPVDGWQPVEAPGEGKIIHAITSVILASVSVINESENYEALLECAVILNGVSYALPDSERELQGSIQDLCVMWWERGLPAKEDMGKTAFVMLLRRSLKTKTVCSLSKGADICRLWRIHRALYCFDYDLEESREIEDMLLECFINVNYIRKEEGRRFLSSLFNWNINFIKMIHGTIKNQLQGLQKSLMVHIAEVYFRAWRKASGKILEAIENGCIQDFLYHGVHLPRKSPVHTRVREVLSYFHRQKEVRQGVEEMLYRLYKPILWRGLKARNSEVRSNAALLFVEAFPIRDPNFNAIEMDSEIQKQFEELYCLPIILDNKLSHPLLEQLLPALKFCLHDNSEKVRVAFVDMLLKVKAVRAAKFWKICPMEHILVRLELDSLPVTRRLVGLIFNSFLPVNQPEEVWCERCVTLLQMNHAAARRFYQHAHEHTACTNIAKLIHVIRHCLNACIRRALSACGEDDEERGKENVSALDQTLSISDAASMAGLLEIVVILWRSIHRSMENNKEAKVYTVSKFASMLPEYMKVFKGNSASKRKVRVQDPRPVKPGLALVYVEYLLTHPKNRECLLSAPQKKLNRLVKALETSKTYLTVCKDVIVVGLGDCMFQTQLLQRSLGIMQTVKGFFYVSLLLGILKEVTRSSLTQKADSEKEVSTLFDLVQKVFQQMLECMARSFRKQPEEGLQLLYSVQTPLHEFISTVQSWHVDTPVHRGVLSTLIAASVVEISHRLRKVSDTKELTPPEGLSALPPFSRCLIGIIIKSPNVVRSFLDELKACVISEDIEGIVCLTAVTHIILVINKESWSWGPGVTQDLVPEATVSSSQANKERTNPPGLFLEPV